MDLIIEICTGEDTETKEAIDMLTRLCRNFGVSYNHFEGTMVLEEGVSFIMFQSPEVDDEFRDKLQSIIGEIALYGAIISTYRKPTKR